jgi:hypothetical protein
MTDVLAHSGERAGLPVRGDADSVQVDPPGEDTPLLQTNAERRDLSWRWRLYAFHSFSTLGQSSKLL